MHSSSLLDTLVLVWETVWERAVPLGTGGMLERTAGADFPQEEIEVLTLLLAGVKTETIARQLSVSVSTIERRVKRIMQRLGTDTRLQAGFELGRVGFGTEADRASSDASDG